MKYTDHIDEVTQALQRDFPAQFPAKPLPKLLLPADIAKKLYGWQSEITTATQMSPKLYTFGDKANAGKKQRKQRRLSTNSRKHCGQTSTDSMTLAWN